MRDPLDVLASFYHHLVNMAVKDGGYKHEDEETEGAMATRFCGDFLNGNLLYGKWQDHIEAWCTSSLDKSNMLWLHYDEMKRDLKGQMTRLAEFLAKSSQVEGNGSMLT